MAKATATEVVEREALWFESDADGMAPLVDAIGESAFVLIGEASSPWRNLGASALERWAHDEVDLPETYPSGM